MQALSEPELRFVGVADLNPIARPGNQIKEIKSNNILQATFRARAGPGPRVPVPSTTARFTTRDIFGSVFTWKPLLLIRSWLCVAYLALVHPAVPEDDPCDLQGPVRGPLVVEKSKARR